MKSKYLPLIALVLLTGCSDKASLETVELNKHIANENGLYNAQAFRQSHPEYRGYNIESLGDSTQSVKCPQGDGWESVSLVLIADFVGSNLATEKDQCSNDLTIPLPKIQK